MDFFLQDTQATEKFGGLTAMALPEKSLAQNILLKGQLGTGKTTFTRGFVRALPGGDLAEVSSPSFNIVNFYPTTPEVAHFDLYRLEGMPADENLMECLASESHVIIIEWIDHLPAADWPLDYLLISFERKNVGRRVSLEGHGPKGRVFFSNIQNNIHRNTFSHP